MRFRNYGIVPVQMAPQDANRVAIRQLGYSPARLSLSIPAVVTDTTVIGYDANGNPLNAEGQIVPGAATVTPGPAWGSTPPAGFDTTVVGYTADGQGFPLNAAGQIVPGAASQAQAAAAGGGNTAAGQATLQQAAAASNQGQVALDTFWQRQPLSIQQAVGYTPPVLPLEPAMPVPGTSSFFSQIPTWGWVAGGAAVLGLGWLALRKPKGSAA